MRRSRGGTGIPDTHTLRFSEGGSPGIRTYPLPRFSEVVLIDPTFVKSHQGPVWGSFSAIFFGSLLLANYNNNLHEKTFHQNFAELVNLIGWLHLRPAREYFIHIDMSSLPMKGCEIRPMLGNQDFVSREGDLNHLYHATPALTQGLGLIHRMITSLCVSNKAKELGVPSDWEPSIGFI
jgi:hypothetical protein